MPRTTEEHNGTEISSLSEMAKFFQEKFDTLPTTRYKDERLDKIQKKTDETVDGLRSLEKRVERIEGSHSAFPPLPPRADNNASLIDRGHISGSNQTTQAREDAFLKAIRSIRVWPIVKDSDGELVQAFDEFLKNT